jgi:hypothetical protein
MLLSVSMFLFWGCADVPVEPADDGPSQIGEQSEALSIEEPSTVIRPIPCRGVNCPKPVPPLGPVCGGFLGTPCPGLGKCLDDPRDDCDPRMGGADCSGLCSCPRTAVCPAGSVFDARPTVCACRPKLCAPNPCAFTDCLPGYTCVNTPECKAVCQKPPVSPCPPCPPGRVCPAFCPLPTL